MKRSLGYVVSIIGVIVLVLGISPVYESIKGFIPDNVSSNNLIVGGVSILIIGVVLVKTSLKGFGRKGKLKEVPIYQGKDVVGYRRMGKKL